MKYTSEIFQKLSHGQFISSNSVDLSNRALYNDLDENQAEYRNFFDQIDFELCQGKGYFYFSRKENKVVIENKLLAFYPWIDYLDFLKTFNSSFGEGYQFSPVMIEAALASNLELKKKLSNLFKDKSSNRDKIELLVQKLSDQGFAELINEQEGKYQVTSAFNYIEDMILCINIDEEVKDEIPE